MSEFSEERLAMFCGKFSQLTGLTLGILIFGITKVVSACPLESHNQFNVNCYQNSSEIPDEDLKKLNDLNGDFSVNDARSWSHTFTIWGSSSEESDRPIFTENKPIPQPEYEIKLPRSNQTDIPELPSSSTSF